MELELTELEEDLETERRGAGEVDDVGLEGTFAETVDSKRIDYGELRVVGKGIAG